MTKSSSHSWIARTAVKDQGLGPAGPSKMLFFLVDTTTATSKDVKGHPDVPALASGDSTTTQSTVTLFSDTSPGTYNIRACADYHKVVVESDENNHCAMATGTVTVQ